MRVAHLWSDYTPSLFDEAHPYCLRQPGVSSLLLAARFLDNGAAPHRETHSLTRVDPSKAFPTGLLPRILRRLRDPFFWRSYNAFCTGHLKAYKPDVLHFHFGTTAARLLPLLERCATPALVSFYGVDASASLRDPAMLALYRRVFKRASLVIVLCDAVKQRLIEAGCPAEKLRVWNLPAGVEKYPYRERRRAGRSTRFLIGARFVEKKGYSYLLNAFERLVSEGLDVTLTMIGYGPMHSRIEQRIRAARIAEKTRLIDTALSSDFATIYARALDESDVFVLPSTTAANGDDEGGPALTMVCAQAAGLPAISTPFAGAERSLIEGVTGLFCRQDDPDSLADKMRWFCQNPGDWAPMGQAGSRHVHENFSLEGQMRRLLELYKETLGK